MHAVLKTAPYYELEKVMVSWNIEYHNNKRTNKNKGMERETTALEREQNASESNDTGSHKYLLRQQLMAGYKDRSSFVQPKTLKSHFT